MASWNLTRREFLKASCAGLAAAATSAGCVKPRIPASAANLLVILTDQQSSWTLGAYGGSVIDTPFIDRIAHEGAIFTNFFTNTGVCTPSRGSLMTGRYPHAHGAMYNSSALNADEVTLGHVLQRNGRRTGYAGKWHLDGPAAAVRIPDARAMGFQDRRYMFNRGHWKRLAERSSGRHALGFGSSIGDEQSYATDFLTTKAIEFIESDRDTPFLYVLSIPDPHPPYRVRAPYDTMFAPDDMSVPVSFNDPALPSWAERLRRDGPFALDEPRRESWLRKRKAQYCGQVKCIDDNVGRLLACLERNRVLDETLVVYTTDHGDYMGEHGLEGKGHLYETAYRVPLLVRWPSRVDAGTRVDQMIDVVDFLPTICGLLDLGKTGREHGRDASALLSGASVEWEDRVFVHPHDLMRAGIFTQEYALGYAGEGPAMLFDRRRDPDQLNDIADAPGYTTIVDELTDRVIRHHREVGSPAARWLSGLRG